MYLGTKHRPTSTMPSPAESNPAPTKRQKVHADFCSSPDDRHSELAAALADEDRLRDEFQRKLAEARARTKEARKCIRAAGEAEFDSLLVVGPDSLSHVLTFLDLIGLGRCERVCKVIKAAAKLAWESYEERHVGRNISAISDARVRVNRLFRASRYVQEVENNMEDHDHREYVRAVSSDGDEYHDFNCCFKLLHNLGMEEKSWPCCYPDELKDLLTFPGPYELYMRIVSDYPTTVFFEGFVASNHISYGMGPTLSINFRGLDFRRWPAMQSHLSSQTGNGEGQEGIFEVGHELKATLVALPKDSRIKSATSLKSGLVCANVDFMKPKTGMPLVNDDAGFHVCAESRIPRCPHFHTTYEFDCRFARLVQSKSGDFVGWKIDDESSPSYSSDEE